MPDRKRLGVSLVNTAVCLILLAFSITLAVGQTQIAPEPFTTDPAALLSSGAQAPKTESGTVILLDEEGYRFETDGTYTQQWWRIYQVQTAEAAEAAASLQTDWQTWRESRPEIRARVVTADRRVHELDPGTIAESASQVEDNRIYTDERFLRAPLPAISADSVVEFTVSRQFSAEYFTAGTVHRAFFGAAIPVLRSRLIVDVPDTLPVRVREQLLPELTRREEHSQGRIKLVFESGSMEPVRDGEGFAPPEVPSWPMIQFSTGSSWAEVAKAYNMVVDRQLEDANLKAFARTAKKTGADRRQVAEALLRALHKEVRYTGVEFGEAAVVPRKPEEVLRRKYGDCKDKAALYVGMLRAAGIPAYVALLSSGPGQDIHPDLPGLGMFDHAMVVIPGTPDLWAETTNEYARIGEIAGSTQGRFALIAAPDTPGLVRTPELPSTSSLSRERREFYLAEMGPARVVEISQGRGAPEHDLRASYGSMSASAREQLEDYVKNAYLAETLDKYQVSEPDDLSTPFQLRLEAGKAGRGATDLEQAVVAVFRGGILNRLPEAVLKEERGDDGNPKERQQDFVLPEAFVTEWEYRITPPPAFELASAQLDLEQKMGPAIFCQKAEQLPDGELIVTLRFDTVKRRFAPQEVRELREAALTLQKSDPLMIQFQHLGQVHLTEGRPREALETFASLVDLHPKEALHHIQMANAMLRLGVGDAARKEIQRALELEPDSVLVHRTRAWILQHDLVGRRFKKGSDFEGAVQAYRRALELEPEDIVTRADLAILLEFGPTGQRYHDRERLQQAILEYQRIQDKLEEVGVDQNLPVALMHAERFAEARERLAGQASTPTREGLILAATAVLEDAAAARREAARRIPNRAARQQALTAAATNLAELRHYALAADVLSAGLEGSNEAASQMSRLGLYRRIQKYEEILRPESDPVRVVQNLQVAIFREDGSPEDLLRPMAQTTHYTEEEKKEAADSLLRVGRALRAQLRQSGISPALLLDLVLSVMQVSVEGEDEFGYRVRLRFPGQSDESFFVIREDGEYRILASPRGPSPVGEQILARLDAGDIDGARRWLDWMSDSLPPRTGRTDDPLEGPVFERFWMRGQEADAGEIRSAAWALIAGEKKIADGTAVLVRARENAAEGRKLKYDLALAEAFSTLKQFDKLEPVAQRLVEAEPRSERAFGYLTLALRETKQWEAWRQAAEERLRRNSNDLAAQRSLALLDSLRGDLDSAMTKSFALLQTGEATAEDWNTAAWSGLLAGKLNEEVVRAAQQATVLTKSSEYPSLHTLAAVYAELGRAAEARQVFLQAMEVGGREEPGPNDWYVLGRIAEEYGLVEAALEAYGREEEPEDTALAPLTSASLAKRRAALLRASASEEER